MEYPLRLKIESLRKRFGEVLAVDGVSLKVRDRTCFGLLGPNGAGKSTMIRSIVGRVQPDSGSISIFGDPAGSSAARKVMGWVPQDLALYSLLTCRENLEAFGRYQGVRGSALREAVGWCIEWAGLAGYADKPVKTLSGGLRRRLNVAAGVIHRPRLVLMDEPTVGVDPQSRNRIFEMVADLRSQGTAVIYTTHYMEEAERLCDPIAIMDHGRIIAQGSKEELVAQSFGGQSDVLIRFAASQPTAAEWARAQGGKVEDGAAHFSIAQPSQIATLLEAAGRVNLEIVDVALRRPNLESVFLQLTGRDLRQ
jgi:ABC-2 type transport system ATP-binding protein